MLIEAIQNIFNILWRWIFIVLACEQWKLVPNNVWDYSSFHMLIKVTFRQKLLRFLCAFRKITKTLQSRKNWEIKKNSKNLWTWWVMRIQKSKERTQADFGFSSPAWQHTLHLQICYWLSWLHGFWLVSVSLQFRLFKHVKNFKMY